MVEGTFVTAINCMDGRVQEPVLEWMKERYGADHVDMITEPGPDKIMAEGPSELIDSIKNRVMISVKGHGSRVIALVSHDDCSGNHTTMDEHLRQNSIGLDIIRSWDLPAEVFGIWIGPDWSVIRI